MKNKNCKHNISVIILIALFSISSLFLLSGCSDTLEGEVNENIKPVVQFVNIPPEGQQFSRNPEIYWMGTDRDGLIDYYRYHIKDSAAVNALGGPVTYVENLSDAEWIQIDVNQTESDPHTTNVMPLVADTVSPVIIAIGQYVFLQGFDTEGLGSDVVYRLFNRNDNPPETRIFNMAADTPFVNSIFEGGIITGVRIRWEGSDRKDYEDIGLTPPPFDFEWRLYGPFTKDTLALVKNDFINEVFVTEDAQVLGVDDLFITCSTSEIDTVIGGDTITIPVEVCDTIVFDSAFFDTAKNTPFYSRDTVLLVDSSIISSKFVESSFNGTDEWVQNIADTIFNVYRNGAPDTTIQMHFLFWLRSRDDAFVKDLTPEFVTFPVINPKYERDIAVIDFTEYATAAQNIARYREIDTAKAFWYNLIHNWGQTSGHNIIFDTTFFTEAEDSAAYGSSGIDYITPGKYNTNGIPIPFHILLKHKVLILYNEHYKGASFGTKSGTIKYLEVLSSLDAGINAWATWRNPLETNVNDPEPTVLVVPRRYTEYFGVAEMYYSAWFPIAFQSPAIPPEDMFRIEDFIGAYSLDESRWPSLDVDTALLHTRMNWFDSPSSSVFYPWFRWHDSLAAVPEVNWSARSFGTEVMYLYKSMYGADHPRGYDYEGSPVGHRFESNLFRTVHMNFTPLVFDTIQSQQLGNSVLDWLYDPTLSGSVIEENRYTGTKYKISIEDARQRFGERIEEIRQRIDDGGN